MQKIHPKTLIKKCQMHVHGPGPQKSRVAFLRCYRPLLIYSSHTYTHSHTYTSHTELINVTIYTHGHSRITHTYKHHTHIHTRIHYTHTYTSTLTNILHTHTATVYECICVEKQRIGGLRDGQRNYKVQHAFGFRFCFLSDVNLQ